MYLLRIGCDQLFGSVLFLSTLGYQGEVDPVVLLCVCYCSLSFAWPCIHCPSLKIPVSMTTEVLAGA